MSRIAHLSVLSREAKAVSGVELQSGWPKVRVVDNCGALSGQEVSVDTDFDLPYVGGNLGFFRCFRKLRLEDFSVIINLTSFAYGIHDQMTFIHDLESRTLVSRILHKNPIQNKKEFKIIDTIP